MKSDFSILKLCENLQVSVSGYYDLDDRRFSPGPRALEDQIWVADITYIPTREGWLYLAGILDLYSSRKIVGKCSADWQPKDSITSNL